jgi:predicted Zn-dependent protease
MSEAATFVINDVEYTWSGKYWTDPNGISPSVAIRQSLNALLEQSISLTDSQLSDVREMIQTAKRAMSAGQVSRALRLTHRALELNPTDHWTAATAVALLRQAHRSDEAIPILQRFRRTNCLPLLITGAAVLCDVERWEDALIVIRRALAIASGKSGEAFSVWSRIKSNRPDLFEA